jgi:hypothetical protein
LPGYRAIGIGPLDLRGGGTDWEFTWRPNDGPRLHERRFLLVMGPRRAYRITWTTPDEDWTMNQPNQQLILAAM